MRLLIALLRDESGATAVEYGLVVAGIALAIVSALSTLGTGLKTTFSSASSGLASAGQ